MILGEVVPRRAVVVIVGFFFFFKARGKETKSQTGGHLAPPEAG